MIKKRLVLLAVALLLAWQCLLYAVLHVSADADDGNYNFANVIVCAYFAGENEAEDQAFFADATTRETLMHIYDGSNGQSFYNYLKTISDGKLLVRNIFPQDQGTGIDAFKITTVSYQEAMTSTADDRIIQEIITTLPGIEDRLIDYDQDGCVDNLTVILRGGKGAASAIEGGVPTMYAHKSNYSGSELWGGSEIGCFNMLNTYNLFEDDFASRSGLAAHEFLHSLDFPDLYNNGEDYPVYCWDIMGSVSNRPSYPLVYMRKKVGEWLNDTDVPTITESQDGLVLYAQNLTDGPRGYILKSPLNDEEFFVIEYRKKPERNYQVSDQDSLDYYIGGSGLIVYRIDTRVEELSNHRGETGVYVFRPQNGQSGYSDQMKECVVNAFLDENQGRTTIGKKESDQTLADGALTYTNGSNSGIVISGVSAAGGDTMTFNVDIPKESSFDMWKSLEFPDEVSGDSFGKTLAMKTWQDRIYMATWKVGSQNQIRLWSYSEGQWSEAAAALPCDSLSRLQMEVYEGALYLAYENYDQVVKIKKLDPSANTWQEIGSVKGNSYFDMKASSTGLWISHVDASQDPFNCPAQVTKYADGKLTNYGTFQHGMLGQSYTAEAGKKQYVSVRDADDVIHVYRIDGVNAFTKVSDGSLSANTFDMAALNDKIYISLGNSDQLKLNIYDGNTWNAAVSDIKCFQPKLVVSEGRIYVLLVPDRDGHIQVVRYDSTNQTFVKEGIDVDGYPSVFDCGAAGRLLCVGFVRNSDARLIVKAKEAAWVPEETETETETESETESETETETETETESETETKTDPEVEVKLTLKQKAMSMYAGSTQTLETVYNGKDTLKWESGDSKIVDVDQKGKLTAKAEGKTQITVTAGKQKAVCTVQVTYSNDTYGFVYRLYATLLGRVPDAGMSTWTKGLTTKEMNGADVASGFVYSSELEKQNLSDDAWIDRMYKTFLNRQADPDGKKTWIGYLDQGFSKSFVFKGFAESDEFTKICKNCGIERGSVKLTENRDQNIGITQFVSRIYTEGLGRKADADGLNTWTGILLNKAQTPKMVASGFIFSNEMESKKLTDDAYVKMLYRVFMGRESDPDGLHTWVTLLKKGTDRKEVFNGFAESKEFKDITKSYGL